MGKRNRRKGRRKKLKTTVQVSPAQRAREQPRPPAGEAEASARSEPEAKPAATPDDARHARGTEPPAATGRVRSPVLETDVTLYSQSNFYTGFTDDIGEGGVFVATEELLPVGTALTLQFSLPDDRGPIEVAGEVRWVRQLFRSEHASGIGVAFRDLPSEARSRIETFLAQRDALFYD